jgi:hypothetical protein
LIDAAAKIKYAGIQFLSYIIFWIHYSTVYCTVVYTVFAAAQARFC